jgi:hypothetical protein
VNDFPFVLPVGLQTSDGRFHRDGVIRRAVALDEIEPLGDERVRRNEAYYPLLVLSRVVTRLGPFAGLTPEILGVLPAADFAYLQDLYASINAVGPLAEPPGARLTPQAAAQPTPQPALPTTIETECPHCGALLELDLGAAGEPA